MSMYRREHYLSAALVSLFVLAVYSLTMAPTVTFWDAGEFIAASFNLGIPHPPGTPLFILIGRVISALPMLFEIAPRLNFFSVLCGTVSALLIFLIAVRLLESLVNNDRDPASRLVVHGGAAASAVLSSFLVTVWLNVTEFEVYAVATATMVLVGWLMMRAGAVNDPARTQRTTLLVIYIVSLSIANHLIVLLAAPAVALYVILHEPERKTYWLSVLGSLFGLYLLVLKGIDLGAVAATLDKRHPGGLSLFGIITSLLSGLPEVLFHLGSHVRSWNALLVGLLVTTACFWWARSRGALGFVGLAAGLFLLGFSVHAYLLIRSGLMPLINEGQPDTFVRFWAVIGREQYGSAYGLLPRQVWSMISGKDEVATLGDLVENVKVFFRYNVPFYTNYFGWQFGGGMLSLLFFAIGSWGAWVHWRVDRKSFWYWLSVFLITGFILNVYMNFKLGFTQANDLFPNQAFHEVRERDYFFIISFAFFGLWAGLGLAGLLDRLRRALKAKPGPAVQASFAVPAVALLLTAFLPMVRNWEKCDRSVSRVAQVYARNLLESLQPGGIVFTNGDNDTFPLWYSRKVEGVRLEDCRVVNLSLLNLPWYIRQMRDMEPRVPISYSDEQLDQLFRFRLERPMKFSMGEVDLTFETGRVMEVQDIILLDILRTNKWEKPLYFTSTVPEKNLCELAPYLTVEGIVHRINPRKAIDIAADDPNFGYSEGSSMAVDIHRTDSLFANVYRFDTFFRRITEQDSQDPMMIKLFGYPLLHLSNTMLARDELDRAMDYRLRARDFVRHSGEWPLDYDLQIPAEFIRQGRYDRGIEIADSLGIDPYWYSQFAQIAVNNGETAQAERFIERALELNPRYREGYAHLFILHNATGNRESAAAALTRYLALFPGDTAVASALERYRAGEELDIVREFGFPAR